MLRDTQILNLLKQGPLRFECLYRNLPRRAWGLSNVLFALEVKGLVCKCVLNDEVYYTLTEREQE